MRRGAYIPPLLARSIRNIMPGTLQLPWSFQFVPFRRLSGCSIMVGSWWLRISSRFPMFFTILSVGYDIWQPFPRHAFSHAVLTILCYPMMHPHTKYGIPTSNNLGYVPDTIIQRTRSVIKVTVNRKWYATIRHLKMHPHSKFWITA